MNSKDHVYDRSHPRRSAGRRGSTALKIEGRAKSVLLYGSYRPNAYHHAVDGVASGTPAVGAGLAGGSGEGKPPQLLELWILLMACRRTDSSMRTARYVRSTGRSVASGDESCRYTDGSAVLSQRNTLAVRRDTLELLAPERGAVRGKSRTDADDGTGAGGGMCSTSTAAALCR